MVDRSLAIKVYRRDNWKCRNCGWRENLTPHHVKHKSQGGKDSLDNLLTLCWECHRLYHEKRLKIYVISVIIGKDLNVKFRRI